MKSYYSFFREQIYIANENIKNELKEFFIPDSNDPILVDYQIDAYIKKNKRK